MPKSTVALSPEEFVIVGWREWLAIPSLDIPAIKAKVDTGARTSALHTFFIEPFQGPEGLMVRFGLHPLQKKTTPELIREAPVLDQRMVSDSGGHREERYFIAATLAVGGVTFETELSLTNRERMRFRMLLGRTAMAGRILAHPGASYLLGKQLAKAYKMKEGNC